MSTRSRLARVALPTVLLLAACHRAPAGEVDGGDAAISSVSAVAPARVEELRTVARSLDALAPDEVRAAEIEARVPAWVYSPGGIVIDPVDARARDELRAIIVANSVEPRLRALALLRLSAAFDLVDLPVVARPLGATADAGTFPREAPPTQQGPGAAPVRWARLALGDVARVAIGALTGADLPSARDVEQWRRDNPDPAASFSFWTKTLEQQSQATRRARLSALRDRSSELFLRVVLTAPHRQAWWDQGDLARTARAHFGGARIVRLLVREESFPELDAPGAFESCTSWLLEHADVLLTEADAAALLSAWEKEGARYSSRDAAKLAIAAARLNPHERARIADTSLGYLRQFRDLVAADLAQHALPAEAERVDRWFRAEGLTEDARIEVRRGILDGLAARGDDGQSHLKRLVRHLDGKQEPDSVIVALVSAAGKMGARDVCPEASALEQPPLRKHGRGPDEGRVHRADRARRECVQRVKRWLARG